MQANLRIRISDRNHNAVIYIAIRVADLVDIAFDAFLARQRGIDHNIANITKRCSVRFSDVKVLSTSLIQPFSPTRSKIIPDPDRTFMRGLFRTNCKRRCRHSLGASPFYQPNHTIVSYDTSRTSARTFLGHFQKSDAKLIGIGIHLRKIFDGSTLDPVDGAVGQAKAGSHFLRGNSVHKHQTNHLSLPLIQ